MTIATTSGGPTGALERGGGGAGGSNLADVVETVLDKGVVIDAQVSVAVVGIQLLEINARIVIASVETYLRFAEAVDRLSIIPEEPEGPARPGGGPPARRPRARRSPASARRPRRSAARWRTRSTTADPAGNGRADAGTRSDEMTDEQAQPGRARAVHLRHRAVRRGADPGRGRGRRPAGRGGRDPARRTGRAGQRDRVGGAVGRPADLTAYQTLLDGTAAVAPVLPVGSARW